MGSKRGWAIICKTPYHDQCVLRRWMWLKAGCRRQKSWLPLCPRLTQPLAFTLPVPSTNQHGGQRLQKSPTCHSIGERFQQYLCHCFALSSKFVFHHLTVTCVKNAIFQHFPYLSTLISKDAFPYKYVIVRLLYRTVQE